MDAGALNGLWIAAGRVRGLVTLAAGPYSSGLLLLANNPVITFVY
jgi:hypothetical protein